MTRSNLVHFAVCFPAILSLAGCSSQSAFRRHATRVIPVVPGSAETLPTGGGSTTGSGGASPATGGASSAGIGGKSSATGGGGAQAAGTNGTGGSATSASGRHNRHHAQ